MTRVEPLGLCFHGIGAPARPLEDGEERYWVSRETFLRILDGLTDIADEVELSFDDGNASDASIALPALVERGLSGRFFVLAGRLDQRGSLAREEVRALAEAGMIVGSHGHDHVSWRTLEGPVVDTELREARLAIEQASGTPVREASCPFGEYDRRALGRLRAAGYDRVHTSDRMRARPGHWLRPRFSVTDVDTPESLRRVHERAGAPLHRLERWAVTTAKRLR